MVTSVSGATTTPKKQITAMDKVSQEQLYDPGMYALRELMGPPPEYRKKGGFFKFLGKLVLTFAIVCAAAVGARKYIKPLAADALKLEGKTAKDFAGFGEKTKYYIAKFGDGVENTIKTIFQRKSQS